MNQILSRISSAHVIALIALFISLGGSSFAATKLITGANIKNGSISQKDLDKALVAKLKLAGKPGPQGIQGATGTAGLQGVAGDPAYVQKTIYSGRSSLDTPPAGGTTFATMPISVRSAGSYDLFVGSSFSYSCPAGGAGCRIAFGAYVDGEPISNSEQIIMLSAGDSGTCGVGFIVGTSGIATITAGNHTLTARYRTVSGPDLNLGACPDYLDSFVEGPFLR